MIFRLSTTQHIVLSWWNLVYISGRFVPNCNCATGSSVAFISNLMESGVEFVAVDMPQANPLTLHIMAAFAQHEREMISQRTRAALMAAKAKGVILGNPRPDTAKAAAAASDQASDFRRSVAPLAKQLQAEGRTLRAVADELNARGVKTARHRWWHPSTVRGLLLDQRSANR